ncbi:solute carrier family 22 member 4-like isoform X2 [Nerophis ophidion]|uniref:solute carrier family 22 member 4-like isoform X2 n=1 Tax=Nerophis ophidion TaxID=159077 RepID=UPI002AE028C6|nr:solute carrier family 22 member 4-like isoform X2 [Nerophis ophidion]
MRDYDTSVAFLGEWGRFQVIVFFMLCSTILPNGTSSFSLVFVADTPAHHCLVPEVNLSQEWRETVIPMEEVNGELARSQCRRYRLDKVRNLSEMGVVPGRDVNLSSLEQEDCLDGWNYSRQLYQSTAVSEFDLVCNKRWRQPLTVTIFFLGVLVESFFSGVLSDRFGRKPVLFGTSVIQSVFSLALLASPSWEVFCVLLFCSGLGNISNYLSCYVLGTEILTGNARVVYASIGVFVAFAFGYMMLPLFAYFLRTWTGLTMANALLGILYMPLWWFLPESPMWLLSQGRVAEAETIVRKAAKMNRVEAPEKIFADYIINAETPEETFVQRYTLLDLLRRKRVAATTFIMTFLWCIRGGRRLGDAGEIRHNSRHVHTLLLLCRALPDRIEEHVDGDVQHGFQDRRLHCTVCAATELLRQAPDVRDHGEYGGVVCFSTALHAREFWPPSP